MSFAWKSAGISYVKYAETCARALRKTLKEEFAVAAARRDENVVKYAKWENGKPNESKFMAPQKEEL